MGIPESTLAKLIRALDEGQWKPGERLPAERALSHNLGVGRSSLRIALAELERLGRIWRHVGQGTFVSNPSDGAIVTTLSIDPPPSPADVFELRLMIEPQIAAAAAMRATAPEIALLARLAEAGAGTEGWADWDRADAVFHTTLARASRNSLLVGVLETMNAIRAQKAWGEMRASTVTTRRRDAYVLQHRAIVTAVGAHDPSAAAAAMRDHLMAVNAAMLDRSSEPALAPVLTAALQNGALDAR